MLSTEQLRLLSAECAVTDAENHELIRSTATFMVVEMPKGTSAP